MYMVTTCVALQLSDYQLLSSQRSKYGLSATYKMHTRYAYKVKDYLQHRGVHG